MFTADEARMRMQNIHSIEAKVEEGIIHAIEGGHNSVNLDYDTIGDDYSPVIQKLKELGYEVSRNGVCLWWEVSW